MMKWFKSRKKPIPEERIKIAVFVLTSDMKFRCLLTGDYDDLTTVVRNDSGEWSFIKLENLSCGTLLIQVTKSG
jgi:hypothetical protein